jgi:alanyl-tRNA synthetase
MQSEEIRKRFLTFFEKRGHKIIPSASLIPENDPSVLFTTAGMQPLVPYLMGTPHPSGKRIADIQKCVRTGDLDDIGDNRHFSFFEMMGNWSLGDYFKKEAIQWSFEFLTSKEEGLGLDKEKLYVTVFEGDQNAPKDEEAPAIWRSLGIPENRIYFLGADDNWWSPGDNGPCGPDSEMFYDMTEGGLGDLSKEDFLDAVKREDAIEIWNDVFMEYQKKDGKVIGKLTQQNVDTGAGLERISAVMQKKKTAYETDLFHGVMEKIDAFSKHHKDTRSRRIVADHIRTSVFLIGDGVTPSNTDQGYILRRLLRRAVRSADSLGMKNGDLALLASVVIDKYGDIYPNLKEKESEIRKEIDAEEERFRKTLTEGNREFEKMKKHGLTGKEAFILFTTYGFPFEMTRDLALEAGVKINEKDFEAEMKKHQDLSRSGAEGKFKGGLADTSEMSVRYHTATHLLHKALREVLGENVFQKGSNITPERLRFDFSFERKMTPEEIEKVEKLVNEKINESLPVEFEDLPLEEAKKRGAIGLFEEKYGDHVRIYKIGNFSLEFCGGPHVKNTKELGNFKIQKEEAVSAGVRRIKAILS